MWQPITLNELEKLLQKDLAECSAEARALFKNYAAKPGKWALSPWGDLGGGFWVVAVINKTVIWFNDIEDGFNTSVFTSEGVIDQYWCNQDSLKQALLGLVESPIKRRRPLKPSAIPQVR